MPLEALIFRHFPAKIAMVPSEYRLPDPAQRNLDAEALLALGRLDGALGACRPTTLRLFAVRLLRDLLIAVLRQEGHAFTGQRFHAWFAGVATLSDLPPRLGRPPRVLCEAVLTELTHSSWELLAELAARFQAVLLAPGDHIGSDLADETARQDAHAIIAAAHDLIVGLAPSPHPLSALACLHRAAGEHVLFTPPERAPEAIAMGSIRLTVERAGAPSPRWALEMLWGEHWRAAGLLAHALPFPGLLRLDALRTDTPSHPWEPDEAPTIVATALRDVAQGLCGDLTEADQLARRLEDSQPGKRRSSRAPALLELLAGFGPLRSAQIEALLGATRLGVRTMLGALDKVGMLERTTLAGVHLYSVNLDARVADDGNDLAASSTFSSAALGEYEAAMAGIDALLARSGVSLDEADWEDEP